MSPSAGGPGLAHPCPQPFDPLSPPLSFLSCRLHSPLLYALLHSCLASFFLFLNILFLLAVPSLNYLGFSLFYSEWMTLVIGACASPGSGVSWWSVGSRAQGLQWLTAYWL